MAAAFARRGKILNVVETLAIGIAGGALFLFAHLPGGLISGAMIAVGIAAIAGRPLSMPPILTQSVLLLLGISLGSLVSQQMLHNMGAYPLTIALLALATFCSTFGSSFYLQRYHGWDQTSALLAGSPGALSQITMLAAEKGADVAGDRGGADHARHHPHRRAAAAAGADRDSLVVATFRGGRCRLAARTRRPDRGLGRGGAAAATVEISGELDVRRDDRIEPAARHRADRGRPAGLAAQRGAGRHRRRDRHPLRADEDQRPCSAMSMPRSDRSPSPSSSPPSSSR